jgi:hypothetical protein
MDKKVIASFIMEILGRPQEHVKQTFDEILEKMGKEPGLRIIEKKVHEPKKLEKGEDLYTSFAEIEVEFDNFQSMLIVIFNYTPSHFEIISPEEIRIKNVEFSDIITNIVLRLHKYDEIAKKLTIDNAVLQNELRRIMAEREKHLAVKEEAGENKKDEGDKESKKKKSKK